MDELVPLDRLAISVVVDNASDGLSPPCACCDPAAAASERAAKYTSEVSARVAPVKAGAASCLDFRAICYGGHGLSLLLEAHVADTARTLLFDGGPSQELFRHNATSLGLDMAAVEALVLSHWHIDHSEGLAEAAAMVSKARAAAAAGGGDSSSGGSSTAAAAAAAAAERPPALVDVHPKRPHRRGLQLPGDMIIPLNQDPQLADLQPPGVTLQQQAEGHTLLGGCFFVSGFIPRVTPYEAGNPSHASQWEPGGPWEADALIEDERYVAAHVKGKGVVVFSACSHAGIVNVMRDVAAKTGSPPYAVFGGLHLAPRDCEARRAPTVADIAAMQPSLVVAGHCTGWQAQAMLAEALPERFMPCAVGGRFSIPAAVELPESRG